MIPAIRTYARDMARTNDRLGYCPRDGALFTDPTYDTRQADMNQSCPVCRRRARQRVFADYRRIDGATMTACLVNALKLKGIRRIKHFASPGAP